MIHDPTFLGFLILINLIGLFSNSYAANYMKNNFDLSKMIYKALLWCCLINTIGRLASVITALYLLNGSENEFICALFEISFQGPYFIVQTFMLQISILRCITRCSQKIAEELKNFQKTVAAFMTPLPFAYLGTFFAIGLAYDKPLGRAQLVRIKIIIIKNKYRPLLYGQYIILH